MKKILYTTTAFVLCGGIVQANAACIATPSCTTLGYTSTTSCTDGLKCPFGSYWNCSISEIRTEITEIKNIIKQQEQENALKSCEIGHIFYSDKTCSVSLTSNKTPIGVVVYTDGQGHGQVISLNNIGNYEWGPEDIDIPTLTNFSSASSASLDLNSCSNSQKIMAAGDKSTYPAVWAANEYSTEGTSAGDWCLPSAGIFSSIYAYKDIVNLGLTNAGGTQIAPYYYQSIHTSTEYSTRNVWQGNFEENLGIFSTKSDSRFVNKSVAEQTRAVLEY